MLYDPKWRRPSMQGFVDWLQTKNPKERYNWSNYEDCACAQYYRSLGRVDANEWMHGPLDRVAWSFDPRERTFGHCLKRAKAALHA